MGYRDILKPHFRRILKQAMLSKGVDLMGVQSACRASDGINEETVRNFVNGGKNEHDPSQKTILAVCKAVGIDPAMIIKSADDIDKEEARVG